MTPRSVLVLILVGITTTAIAQEGHQDWEYVEVSSALETTRHLVLRGYTAEDVEWVISRTCAHGVTQLLSRAADAGDALDIDLAYYRHSMYKSGKTGCLITSGLCNGWQYKTRTRVDQDSVRTFTWMYGFDSDGGWEFLWRREAYYSNLGSEQAKAGHSMDRLFMGERLAIEISASKGVAVFNTAGFEEALNEWCGGQPLIYEV